MNTQIIITGTSGFLGQELCSKAALLPSITVIPIFSPRSGGIDLAQPDSVKNLTESFHISHPEDAILIHAAAAVQWDAPGGLINNSNIALNVATWAKNARIGHSVFVSGVNVYSPQSIADIKSPCQPTTYYGLGKLVAEHIWRMELPKERSAIVRLAGLLGWQQIPTLFWNRLLLTALLGSAPGLLPVVNRKRSRRNYIAALEAGECLLHIGINRLTGSFLLAGRDIVDTYSFIDAVQHLPGSRLSVDWQDDGGSDEQIYRTSGELLPLLKPFPEVLSDIWNNKPGWILKSS